MNNSIKRIGYWSAVFTALEVGLFGLLLIVNLFAKSESLNMLSYLVCFLLAPTFIVMMASVFYYAAEEKKFFAHLGLIFAAMYGVMITTAYYLQLTVVRINSLDFSKELIALISYDPGSAIFSLNILGYAFMSLAVFVIFPVFSKLDKWIRGLLIFNGIVGVLSVIVPGLDIFGGATNPGAGDLGGSISLIFWSIIFTPIPILIAKRFNELKI